MFINLAEGVNVLLVITCFMHYACGEHRKINNALISLLLISMLPLHVLLDFVYNLASGFIGKLLNFTITDLETGSCVCGLSNLNFCPFHIL